MAEKIPLTPEQRAFVLELDAKAVSASQIAHELFNRFGVVKTENAITNVVYRSGARKLRKSRGNETRKGKGKRAAKRQSRVSNNHVGGRAFRPAPVAAPMPAPEPLPAEPALSLDLFPHRVGLMAIGYGQCRRVVGRGEDGLALFCGAPARPETSWCPTCAKRMLRQASAEDAA